MTRRSSWITSVTNQFLTRLSFNRIFGQDFVPVAKRGSLNFVGLLVATLSAFIFQFILGRNFNPSDVGLFNLGLTISSIIGLIMLAGLDRGVVKFIAASLVKNNRSGEIGSVTSSFKILILIIIFVTPIALFFAQPLSVYIFNKPALTPILKILIISLPFFAFTRWAMGIFLGYKHVKPMVYIEQITVPVLRIIGATLVVFFLTKTLVGISMAYILATIAGFGITLVVFLIFFRRERKGISASPIYRDVLLFSLPLLFSGLLNRTNTYTETLILGGFAASEQVGIYTIALKISIILPIFFEAINGIWAPYIADLLARNALPSLSEQFKSATYWAFTLTLPFALFMFLEAHSIMAIFGEEYIIGAPILQILTISQVVYVLGGMSALMLIMAGFARLNLIDLIITLILSLVLDFSLIPAYGAFGAAIASMVTVITITLLRSSQVFQKLRIHAFQKDMLKPIAAALIAWIICLAIRQLTLDFSYVLQMSIVITAVLTTYGTSLFLFSKKISKP